MSFTGANHLYSIKSVENFYIFYNLPRYSILVPRRALFLVKSRHLDTTVSHDVALETHPFFPSIQPDNGARENHSGPGPHPIYPFFSITIIRDDYIGNIVFSDSVTNTVF